MRIVHAITRLILGGAQELLLSTCREQLRLGHDVTLLYGRSDGPEGSLAQEARTVAALQAIDVPSLVADVAARDDDIASRHLEELISDLAPDVVHTHTHKAGVLGRAAACAAGTACVVHTIHGMPFYDELPRQRTTMIVARERIAAAQCHRLVCVSAALRAKFLAAGVGSSAQYRLLRTGLSCAPYVRTAGLRQKMRARLGIGEGDVLAGTIARLDPLKGHRDLLAALGDVLRRMRFLKLVWVGAGAEYDRLRSAVAARGLDDQIKLVGAQQPAAIPGYLAAMDLLVHPSYREGYPLALVQALRCGLPVVAYDIDGTRDLCVDGTTGFLVPKGRVEPLTHAIVALASDGGLRAGMGASARRHPAAAVDDKAMVADLQDIYCEVLR